MYSTLKLTLKFLEIAPLTTEMDYVIRKNINTRKLAVTDNFDRFAAKFT